MFEFLAVFPFVVVFGITSLLAVVFVVRQAFLTLFERYRRRPSAFAGLKPHRWFRTTIIIPAHNEELVIGGCLEAICGLDYPRSELQVVVIDDRSTDRTGEIARSYSQRMPCLRVLTRNIGAAPGKPAAIAEAIRTLDCEIIVFFDADYLPAPGLLKLLLIPFVDPEVGATMGRVVPYNTDKNLLTKLIDLERRAGYTVDQRARTQLNWLPQFGGTVGGVRVEALKAVGGWRSDVLAEDTDLTYRLLLEGWTVEYLDHAMCYEESPETWAVRFSQVCRWAYGHNQCALRYFLPVARMPGLGFWRRLDALVVLLFFVYPVASFFCLIAALCYPIFFDYPPFSFVALPTLTLLIGFGNFVPFFQIAVALRFDKQEHAGIVAPLFFVSSTINMLASAFAVVLMIRNGLAGRTLVWRKTRRFRKVAT